MTRLALVCMLLTGCALAADLDEAQDADEAAGDKSDLASQSCQTVRCGNAGADAILFPGNPACSGGGCERRLADDELFVPPRNGLPWGDTYEQGVQPARVLSGYSSGRIALLRRLALVDDGEHAVMLDPSWEDGERDFLNQGGPIRGAVIVQDWLRNDGDRTFTLIYSTRSTGWASYAALQSTDVGDRVRVCKVSEPHLLVPTVRDLHTALTDPLAWDNGTCTFGG